MIDRGFHTRDRVPFRVRDAAAADREPVLALQREAVRESDEYFVRTPAEFEAEELAIGGRLLALLAQDNSLWLVAERGEEVIGSLDFHGGQYERIRHVGHFGLTVVGAFRNRGVGSALVETMLAWAHDHPVLEKVCTTLFTNNTRAVALYTRFGFRSEGRRHREYMVAPGRRLDALLLAKWIK